MSWPRRSHIPDWTEAEIAINAAMAVVERLGADVRLTDAVNLLSAAQASVADYVDGVSQRRFVTEGELKPALDADKIAMFLSDQIPFLSVKLAEMGERGELHPNT